MLNSKEMKKYMIMCLLFGASIVHAQENDFLERYRKQVIDYNQDIKAADHSAAMYMEMKKSAKADFLPQLSANANFNYTGHPLELTRQMPGMESPVSIQGKDTKYGASLTLAQPLYTGGAIKAGYEKSKKETEMAEHEKRRVRNNVIYDADVYYWNAVAQTEMVRVAEEYKASVERLVEVVKHRVEVDFTDKNDLLLTEVKLNDARYQLLQAQNSKEISRMKLNSFAGVPFSKHISIAPAIQELRQAKQLPEMASAMNARPELKIAQNKVDIQTSISKIEYAKFLPKFSLGVDGSYSSPGYDLTSDLSPNYAVYAKLSIPIFEWGKRKSTRKAGKFSVNMAKEYQSKLQDQVRLEIETSYYSYAQAVEKVLLTESSLQKAAESESVTMSKYKEGNISIVEAIDAQIYHQQAKVNYIQSKLNAQLAKSKFEWTIGRMNN